MILTTPSSKYAPWGGWLPKLKYGAIWTFLNQLANTSPSHLNSEAPPSSAVTAWT